MKKNGVRARGTGSHGQQSQGGLVRALSVGQGSGARCHGIAFLALAFLVACGLAQATDVGRTKGSFHVDQDGAATYTIPIFAPRGPDNLEPHIALVYSSQGSYSYAGMGWSIAGLSEIYRCNKTVAQDGAAASVQLVTADGYCLDGQRLRLTSGTYGTAASVYQTEIANFSQVTAEGTSGNGPDHWEVQGKDGLTYEYGSGGLSQVIPETALTPYQWWLDKVTDRAGNTMTITYSNTHANGEVVPNTISWTPSSYGSTSSYQYTMVFSYTTNSTAASLYGYVDGIQVSNSNHLQSIAIQYNGATIKDYLLNQQPSPTTSLELLASLQECTDSTKADCLPATQFNYQTGNTGSSSLITAVSGTATKLKVHNDFTGGGYNDLTYCNGGTPNTIYVAFASQNGYGSPVNTGIPCNTPLYGDLTGGGKDGILVPNGTDWWYYTWNGSAFSGQDTGLAYDSTASQYVLADINGDGLPDLISGYLTSKVNLAGQLVFSYQINARMNTSAGGTASFSSANNLWYGPIHHQSDLQAIMISDTDYPYGATSYGTLKALDFNGDGNKDIALETITPATGGGYTVATYELISGSSSFTAVPITSGSGSAYGATTFLDFNSDKCTDYAYGGVIYVSGCNGTVGQQISLGANIVGAMDWDGDGRTDVLVQNGSTIGVYLSEGNAVSGLISTSIPYNSSDLYFSFNANGDHLDDLGVYASSSTVSYYLHNGEGQPPDLLSSITDGYGNTIKPTYVSLAWGTGSTYTPPSSAPAGYEPYYEPVYLVSQVAYSDNAAYALTHSYSGALENLAGRGFAGFSTHTVLDSRNNLSETQGFGQVFPDTGMLTSDVVTDTGHSLTVSSASYTPTNTELSTTQYEETWFPHISSSTRKEYQVYESGGTENGDLITSTTSSTSFDSYGNLTSSSQTITDSDPGSPYSGNTWTTSVSNTWGEDAANWCLTLLSSSQVSYSTTYTGTGGGEGQSVSISKSYTPDTGNPTKCRYTQIVTQPGTAYQVTEQFGYDTTFGNIISDTVIGTGMPARQSTVTWDATGQFPVIVQDPLGHADGYETQIGYDYRFGLKTSEVVQTTGGVQNAPPTQWSYDAFGRLETETQPDHTSATWSYSLYSGIDPEPRMVVTEQSRDTAGSVFRIITQQLDMLDRPYITQVQLIDGSTDTVMQRGYDPLGRVISAQEPYQGGTVGAVTASYDALNRPTEIQLPNSSTPTAYLYAGRTTTITDPNRNAKTLIHDVNGWLRETKDATGYAVILGYDAAGGHVLTTDNQGNTGAKALWSGTVQYGIAPFTVQATDADLGTWQYTIDALGELTAWKDPKNQNFSAKYDALSRMTDRYEPDLYSHWVWGTNATAHDIGQLESACTGTGTNPTACTASTGYAESESYDSVGRPSQRSITIPGDATYTYAQTYNADGLPDTLTYPASTGGYSLALKYGYAYGLLDSITDTSDSPSVTLWTANAMDALGQYTKETFGNGVVVNHAFDVTGLLRSITAGPAGSTTLQNSSYWYDPVGNLSQRQDSNAGTTESVYYDSLNRLSYTVGDTNTHMSYDSMGRIASWEAGGATANVTDFTTPQSGCTYYTNAQPHAVRKSTQGSWSQSFCYDANGNMTTQTSGGTVQRTFAWTSFNQPSAITAGSVSSSYSDFYYDENHQRYEQIASYAGSSEVTEYIGRLMEKMTNSTGTAYRYYAPAGNNFVVYNRWLSGTNAIDYATKDDINSTAIITDSTGALVVAEKFSALGWNENTSAQQTTMASITRHEFTGQEGLDNYGLWMVDMNGRVYQPSGAYFYSPDPHIQDPANTQNYDRYSYVYNNPLTYIDPTGYCGGFVSYGTWHSLGLNGTGMFPTTEGDLGWGAGPSGYFSYSIEDETCGPSDTLGSHGQNNAGPSGGGGAGNSSSTQSNQNLTQQGTQGCPQPGIGARVTVGNAIANWGQLMSKTSGDLAGMGGTLALGSGAMGTFIPVTAPVAAFGVAAGVAASAVGGVGSVIGGAAVWVGGLMSGNITAANYGFLTAVVNAVLAKAEAPPLPYGAPDPAEMVARAAGASPAPEGAAICP